MLSCLSHSSLKPRPYEEKSSWYILHVHAWDIHSYIWWGQATDYARMYIVCGCIIILITDTMPCVIILVL